MTLFFKLALFAISLGFAIPAQLPVRVKEDPHRAQNQAAFARSFHDARFQAAVSSGDASAAQRIVVANGASRDVVVAVRNGGIRLSTGESVDFHDNDGTCIKWQDFTWWTDIPAPGHYYVVHECVRIIDKAGNLTYYPN